VTHAQCFQGGIVSRIAFTVASERKPVAEAENMAFRRQIAAIS
jgi:hypothetical protein